MKFYEQQKSQIENAKRASAEAVARFGSATIVAESWECTTAKYLLAEAAADPNTVTLAKMIQNSVSQQSQWENVMGSMVKASSWMSSEDQNNCKSLQIQCQN